MKIFFGSFSKTHKIFSLKKIFLHAFHPTKHCFVFTKKKKKKKEFNPCNCKILTHGPLSYLFQEMKPPFIESKKSRFVKGVFPLRSNENDKRSLNWWNKLTKRWEQIPLICEGDYMVHNYMYKSFTYAFENVIYHFTIVQPFYYFSSALNEMCEIGL